ncbi:MAG: hypothetical protein HYV16_07585 [Gammaproteobacteria bacterium]|nr:hypothetical protein [Gammaproteobacteria bacterium]
MDENQQPHITPDDTSPPAQCSDAEALRLAARRSFLKGALIASPIVMSLASRPVMATTRRYCTASGFMSGNVSQPVSNQGCGGLSPGYWKTHTNWPTPYLSGVTTGTKFHDVFNKGKYNYNGKTMMWVLQNKPGSFAFHTIACLLNSASNFPDYALKGAEVIAIWNAINTIGYYTTSTGQQMYEQDAKAFFENTYH